MTNLIEIDGSSGEGGGQVVRGALALSLGTGRAFRAAQARQLGIGAGQVACGPARFVLEPHRIRPPNLLDPDPGMRTAGIIGDAAGGAYLGQRE